MKRRTPLIISSLLAAGLTVDLGSRVYDKVHPAPNGIRSLFSALPLRAVSRAWGSVADTHLPVSLRSPLFRAYGAFYGVNFEEAQMTSLSDFENVQAFFTRRLKQGTRPQCSDDCLSSPVDGRVMSCGPVDLQTGLLPTVKGFNYRLGEFIGCEWPQPIGLPAVGAVAASSSSSSSKKNNNLGGRKLYQAVLYLAPGDYHWFHTPCKINVYERHHFAGLLLPVAPWMLRSCPSLFEANERVVLFGNYQCGSTKGTMAYTAVGATNVGSISLSFDGKMKSNSSQDIAGKTKHFRRFKSPVELEKGSDVGVFKMGSTIVLLFDADADFEFSVKEGDRVRVGQEIGKFLKKRN